MTDARKELNSANRTNTEPELTWRLRLMGASDLLVPDAPSRATCVEAADEIERLSGAFDKQTEVMVEANREIERLRGLLTEVANSGVEATGVSRYLTIQISDVTWAELGEWRVTT